MQILRIGTRGSKLALWQAEHLASKLRALDAQLTVELELIKTSGDKFTDRPLSEVMLPQNEQRATSNEQQLSGKGLFVKEIEEALLEKRIDLAVHSLKDLPGVIPDELELAAVLEREDPRDALISDGVKLDQLAAGAKLGTCSPRRAAQIKRLRADLEIVPLRGNLDTRLCKVAAGEVAATLLAMAGLKRMGWQEQATEVLSPELMLPAAGQGIIGLEVRRDGAAIKELCLKLNHGPSMLAALAERAFVRGVGADCHSPVAAYAVIDGEGMVLSALVAAADGSEVIRMETGGQAQDAEMLGRNLAEKMLAKGAGDLIA